MRVFSVSLLACTLAATTAFAKPPLRDVAEIDDPLMMVAIAHEISETCGDIGARIVRGTLRLQELRSRANAMGYSDKEIRAYVKSKSEKRRMRSKAEKYLAGLGVRANDTAELCRFGKMEMQSQSEIGRLLK